MNDKKTSVRTLTMLALLVAMSIVFSRVLSISTGFVRFNLGSLPVLLAALLFCLPLTQWCKNHLENWVVQDGRGQGRQALVSIGTAMMNVALLLVCTALLVGDSYNPFLYFRF